MQGSFHLLVRNGHQIHQYQHTVARRKTGRSILLAITPLTITLGLKVRGVLKNSGNSQSDRH